ncbi:MAG: HEAT repeat domain-containing protein [Planctomycetaceae bacterium]|nr:HEAT repeat domain-containing protein [Planctomycetaceae bacterium]
MKRILISLMFVLLPVAPLLADDAWNAVKTYKYGDDFKPLLAVEAEVQRSAAAPETKVQTAARLAALLNDNTTPAGRQFVCMQLRLVGGTAEVAKLTEYLNKPEDAENARLALTDIQCEESLVSLRKALETFKGRELTGIIGSLSARNDKISIPAIAAKLKSDDPAVAAAAASALGRFGIDGLDALIKAKSTPNVDKALLNIANQLADAGKTKEAAEIFTMLSDIKQPVGIRRAAFHGLLRMIPDKQRKDVIAKWFFEDDKERNDIAASYLSELSDRQFDGLYKRIGDMSSRSRIVFFEIAAERSGADLLDSLTKALQGNDEIERLTALRTIGRLGDASTIPLLLDALEKGDAARNIAKEALTKFPANAVGAKLIEALQKSAIRNAAIDVIVAVKCYDAIDPMIPLAKSEDDTIADPIITGLGRLCDPDDTDLTRMLALYLASRPGAHREKVERAIVIICEKLPDAEKRADALLKILEKKDGGLTGQRLIDTLPLLGKVGNKRVAEMIRPLIDGNDPALQSAAVRAFCNFPNADYLDDIWKIAANNSSEQYRQWALRAFIRVATLKSERPESETLGLLKKAMNIATTASDKQWCLSRAATVRTMESVDWAASFLDDAVLSQTACSVIAELAYHRFLREPNKAKFEPLLLKVEQTAKNKDVVERAKKARLGM